MGILLWFTLLLVIHCSPASKCPSSSNRTDLIITCHENISISLPQAVNLDKTSRKPALFINVSTFENFLLVKHLEIQQITIAQISTDTFSLLTCLETLILENVSLSNAVIHQNAFAGLQAKSLSLKNNRLHMIYKQIFADSDYIEHLDLSGNQISFIEDNAFARLTKLKKLNVANNRLITVSPYWFGTAFYNRSIQHNMGPSAYIDKTDFQLNLMGNNLTCECQYRGTMYKEHQWFTQAIAANNWTCNWNYSIPSCDTPHFFPVYKEILIIEHSYLYVHCNPRGYPKPKVKWFLPKGVQSHNSTVISLKNGTLKITSVKMHFYGTYACLASNSEGSAVRLYQIKVVEKPVPFKVFTPAFEFRPPKENKVVNIMVWSVIIIMVTILSIVFICLMKQAIECHRYNTAMEDDFDKFVATPSIVTLPKKPPPLPDFQTETDPKLKLGNGQQYIFEKKFESFQV